jgi:hypothetical protein
MEKEFIPYELSLRMKALGFDEPCFSYYELDGRLSDTPKESGDDIKYQGDCKFDNHQNTYLDEDESCSAPLFQQAFRWFREKHRSKHIWIMDELLDTGEYTYDEAELACLKYCIEIVENK